MRTIPSSIVQLFLRRILVLAILFFRWSSLHAQYVDTAAPIQVEEIDAPAEDTDDEEENEYFQRLGAIDSLRVNQRNVPDSVISMLKGDQSYWYSRNGSVKGNRKQQPRREVKNGDQVEREPVDVSSVPYKSLSSQPWFQTLMWIIIIGGFAGAVAWYLANNQYTGLFRKKEKKLAEDEKGDEIPENIFAINYQQEIDKAAGQGNYRLAIRLMYLRILRNLAERNIIQYKQDKTNFDYLMQLHPTVYYKDFFRVTRHYEYSWYGEFNVSLDAYAIIRNEFEQFEKIQDKH